MNTGLFVFARAMARLVDTLLCSIAVGVVVRLAWPDWQPGMLLVLAGLYGSAALGSVLLPLIGSTPGKLLFGLEVRGSRGQKPSLRQALSREKGWIRHGVWFGAGPILFLPASCAALRLLRGAQARWDVEERLRVRFYGKPDPHAAVPGFWEVVGRLAIVVPGIVVEAWLLVWLALATWGLASEPREMAWATVRSLVTAPRTVAASIWQAVADSIAEGPTPEQYQASNEVLVRALVRDYGVDWYTALRAVCPESAMCSTRVVSYAEASRRLEMTGARRRSFWPEPGLWREIMERWKRAARREPPPAPRER